MLFLSFLMLILELFQPDIVSNLEDKLNHEQTNFFLMFDGYFFCYKPRYLEGKSAECGMDM